MSRRAYTIVSLAVTAALAFAVFPSVGAATTRRAPALAAHEPAMSIGIGHGIGTSTHMIAPLPATHPLLTVPVPSAIQERRLNATPAVRPSHDPFPDFSVPLRRHRMAMPNGAFPAMGDLAF